jgi:hypothetical protein
MSRTTDKDESGVPAVPGGGLKYDNAKPDFSLLSPIAIARLAQVLTFGAEKYESHNWRKGIGESRLLAAALRHIMSYMGGEENDPQSGLPHTAHAMCCLMFIVELHETSGSMMDDRYMQPLDMQMKLRAIMEGRLKEVRSVVPGTGRGNK